MCETKKKFLGLKYNSVIYNNNEMVRIASHYNEIVRYTHLTFICFTFKLIRKPSDFPLSPTN